MLCATSSIGPGGDNSGPIFVVESSESEPELIFRLSDQNEFYCSACGDTVASLGNGRFAIGGIPGLIAAFREHVQRQHPTQVSGR
jgi:hypothetical protein